MQHEQTRQRLINFLASSGIKQNYIAQKTGIPTAIISRFKNNKKVLLSSSLNDLASFLTEHGY